MSANGPLYTQAEWDELALERDAWRTLAIKQAKQVERLKARLEDTTEEYKRLVSNRGTVVGGLEDKAEQLTKAIEWALGESFDFDDEPIRRPTGKLFVAWCAELRRRAGML